MTTAPPVLRQDTDSNGPLPRSGFLGSHVPNVVFAFLLVVICGAAVRVGVAPLRLFEHDVFFLLDNGYRVAQGQVPHRDFSSAWGPVIFLIEAAGLRLSGMRPEGIGYANALFGALIGLWTWWIARKRCSPIAGCILGLFSALLITAPFSLGWGALNFSHAMIYNRYGYAILGIILVECATQPDRSGGISTGVACALLAWLKITYALMAAPFVLFALAFGGSRKMRLAAISCGAAAVTLLVLCYLRFDLADVLRDLLMAASGRARSWNARDIRSLGFAHFSQAVLLLVLAAMASIERKPRTLAVLLALLTFLIGIVVVSTNHQPSGLPLSAYAAVVFGTAAVRRYRAAKDNALVVAGVILAT